MSRIGLWSRKLITVTNAQVICIAWTDILSGFVQSAHNELLVMSPWITTAAARLISHGLAGAGPVKLQIIARLDESDFLTGASHVDAFRPEIYPPNARPEFRALPMLHGKMLLSDRKRVIIGSANMTDGGLYRNHEVCLLLDSPQIGQDCADAFFKFWHMASPLPTDYLSNIESILEEALPNTDEEVAEPPASSGSPRLRTRRRTPRFKYLSPSQATKARRHLADILALGPPDEIPPEGVSSAMSWLTGVLKSLPREKRLSDGVIRHVESLMYHPDLSVRSTAIDRAGRNGLRSLVPRLQALATNPTEPERVRSAAAFSLAILGSQEAFATLATLSSSDGDVGRWARRGCFLLLDVIHQEDQIWFLSELQVQDPVSVVDLARRCQMASGMVSERMTKALLVEKCATGLWTESDVEALACIMMLVAQLLNTRRKRVQLGMINQSVAEAFGVAPGDLRHGPLSPSLLRSLASSGFSDPGLSLLLGPTWAKFKGHETSVREVLSSAPRFSPVLGVIESYQPNKPDAGDGK